MSWSGPKSFQIQAPRGQAAEWLGRYSFRADHLAAAVRRSTDSEARQVEDILKLFRRYVPRRMDPPDRHPAMESVFRDLPCRLGRGRACRYPISRSAGRSCAPRDARPPRSCDGDRYRPTGRRPASARAVARPREAVQSSRGSPRVVPVAPGERGFVRLHVERQRRLELEVLSVLPSATTRSAPSARAEIRRSRGGLPGL